MQVDGFDSVTTGPWRPRPATDFEQRKAGLLARLGPQGVTGGGVKKRTSSNLFRYAGVPDRRALDLSDFNHVLGVARDARIVDVEAMATFEQVVERTLASGLVPLVTPELKHITVGGAIVGVGIESSGFRHGYVHDALLEAEVLLANGAVVTATADNEHAPLFHGLPNSYGTLGYILRAKLRLMPARRYVHLATSRCDDLDGFADALRRATEQPGVDFIEGLIFSAERQYLTVSRFVDAAPRVDDIVRENIFYRLLAEQPQVYLTARDYLFRYDPDWFWNIPQTRFYDWVRRYAPLRWRNSGVYKRYVDAKARWRNRLPWTPAYAEEPLIQDWEVPWEQGVALTRAALAAVDLGGRPWLVTPIRSAGTATLYPVVPGRLYYNLGCYCQVRKAHGEAYTATKRIDQACFERGGIKMLYSSSFLDRAAFDRVYNGAAYAELKRRYDPGMTLGELYAHCVIGA